MEVFSCNAELCRLPGVAVDDWWLAQAASSFGEGTCGNSTADEVTVVVPHA
jgi:hypothetical protein